MEKVKKENIKKIKKKRSFLKMYKMEILFILICLIIIGTMADLILTDNKFLIEIYTIIALFIVSACCLTAIAFFVKYVVKIITSIYRQTKIPLTLEELDMLNIKTPKEYSDFLEEYLNGFDPIDPIDCDKILFISFVYLYNEKISTEEKLCILNNLYELHENKENNGNNNKKRKKRSEKRIITENDFKIIFEENITLKAKNKNLISNSNKLIRLVFEDTWMEDVLEDHFTQIYFKNKAEEGE